jgi:hypothetical protein
VPRPDISTAEALKKTLLAAKSIVLSSGPSSFWARTATPTPDFARSTRPVSLPSLTKASIRAAGMMTMSATSPPATRLTMSRVPPQSTVAWWPVAFSKTGMSSR